MTAFVLVLSALAALSCLALWRGAYVAYRLFAYSARAAGCEHYDCHAAHRAELYYRWCRYSALVTFNRCLSRLEVGRD